MPESMSNQSSTPTPYNVTSSGVPTSDDRWNQVDSSNNMETATPLEWSELPTPNIVPVPVTSNNISSDHHITSTVNNINILSNQMVYSPPNYMNIPYQRSVLPNGYTTLNHPRRGINAQIIHNNGPNVMQTSNGSLIGGSTWSNQIHLGRCINQSPAWTSNKVTGGVKKQKRIRTAFTSQQMMELEQEYARTRYLDRARRIELAEILHLNERTIKIWFQNRRMKEKKDRAESLEDSEEATTSESSPELGNIQMPMLIHEQYPGVKNEAYNQRNIYVEQYPASSTPVSMPVTSSTSMAPIQAQTHNMYPTYMTEEECHAQYQQVQLQVHPQSSPYSEVQELSPDAGLKTEHPTPSAPSNIIEKSWDLSWIRIQDCIQYETDY